MDIGQLQSFLTLAEAGSFTRAAARQHLSQPALSRRIRSLEHWVGADLVDRSTYPVTLTRAGRQLRDRAAGLLDGLQEVRDEARRQWQLPRGAVHVVTSHALAYGFFPGWWQRVCAGGSLPCKVTVANTLDAYDAITAGACDLLLIHTDAAHPVDLDPTEHEYLVLGTDTVLPYACDVDGAPAYRLPGTPDGPVPLLDYGSGAFFGRLVEEVLAAGDEPAYVDTRMVTDLAPALLALVRDGHGVAWLPGTLAATADGIVAAGAAGWGRELEIRLYRRRPTADGPDAIYPIWRRAEEARSR